MREGMVRFSGIGILMMTLTVTVFCAEPKPQLPDRAFLRSLGVSLPDNALSALGDEGRIIWENLDPATASQVEQSFLELINPIVQNYLEQHPQTTPLLPTNRIPNHDVLPTGYATPTGTVSRMAAPPPGGPMKVKLLTDKSMGIFPLTVNFKAQWSGGSSTLFHCSWNFGDGSNSSTPRIEHTFSNTGDYTVSLTVFGDKDPPVTVSSKISSYSPTDSDLDTIPDFLEDKIGLFFTPSYHVSAGENTSTGFATFQDRTDRQAVLNLYASEPPISYYRVTPCRYSGNYIYLKIDYLTLWDRDDGICIDGLCEFAMGIWGISSLIGLGHDLDNERSSLLIRAPIVDGGFNPDAMNYQSVLFYAAAHEGTVCDHSQLFYYENTPLPPGSNVRCYLSRSKHATYNYNPDYSPILPDLLIADIYFSLIDICASSSAYDCALYTYLADVLCYGCIVEHFWDQGGSSNTRYRINIGELPTPSPGCRFINTSPLVEKFDFPECP